MRVLMLITRGEPGGAQVHVRDLVRGLRDRVAFFVGVGEDGFLPDALRSLDVPVRVLDSLQRAIDLTQDRRALQALRGLIREVAPDLVHTHSTKAGLLGRIAARLEGVPAVHTAHAWSFSDGQPRRRVLTAVPPEAVVGRITTRFIVVSEADREIALRYRVARPDQVRVVHNGVADHPGRATPDADPPTITMVARMAAPKDHALLVDALAAVERPWRLRLVGDGPDRPALEARIQARSLGGRIELLGTRSDVPELLADSQIATLVSKQEGFPLVVLEAMRAGLPVVASDVGGIREALTPDCGTLVARGDQPSLTRALDRLLADPALRAAQGAAGRARYESHFTAARMVARTAAVYDELARDHALPRVSA